MSIREIVAAAGVIRRGARGARVEELQARLCACGFPIAVDGVFLGETEIAVEAFQRRAGLKIDGQVGLETAAALDRAAGRQGSLGRDVAQQNASREPEIAAAGEPSWLVAARAWLGTREVAGSGDNPTIMGWARKLGGTIAKLFTGDAVPWCALFANQVLVQVGLRGTGSLWALDFARWGQRLPGPAVGAFASMRRAGGGGHIAIVVGRTASGDLVAIGGNQSDAVTIAVFDPARVVAWTWPAGADVPDQVGWHTLPMLSPSSKRSSNEA